MAGVTNPYSIGMVFGQDECKNSKGLLDNNKKCLDWEFGRVAVECGV